MVFMYLETITVAKFWVSTWSIASSMHPKSEVKVSWSTQVNAAVHFIYTVCKPVFSHTLVW